jgi:hypothetical protein
MAQDVIQKIMLFVGELHRDRLLITIVGFVQFNGFHFESDWG